MAAVAFPSSLVPASTPPRALLDLGYLLFVSRRLDLQPFPSSPAYDVAALYLGDTLYFQATPAVYIHLNRALARLESATPDVVAAWDAITELRGYVDTRFGPDAVEIARQAPTIAPMPPPPYLLGEGLPARRATKAAA